MQAISSARHAPGIRDFRDQFQVANFKVHFGLPFKRPA
jgi:hypothetical protein